MGWGFDSKSRKERQVTPVEERESNVLGTAPIGRLMLKLAVPAVAAQFINMLYNIVDRIYIGHIPEVGDLALTGVGVTFPIITLVSAFAAFAGQGGAPLAAIQLGAGKKDQAWRMQGNALALLLMTAAVLAVGFSAFKEPILRAFGASDATIGYASSYIGIYLLGTVFVQLALGLNTFISAQGKAMTAMLSVLIGAVLNIVLAPIFIFVFHWGVRGAALATILSQAVSACWVLAFLCCPHSILRIRRAYVRPDPRVMGKIAGLGVAPFIMQSTESLVTVVLNTGMQTYGGDLYVGVMTIINSLREVFFMPVHGLSNGSQPVMGFNYGAGLYSRVRKSIRFSCGLTVAYAAAFWAAAMLLPELMIRVFNSEPEVIAAGVPALRVYFALFIPMSLQSAGQSVFVALGRSKQAVFFSLLRKAIINAPLTVILPIWMGTMGVFYAEAASQLIGGLACFATMYFTLYRPLGRLKDGEALPEHL